MSFEITYTPIKWRGDFQYLMEGSALPARWDWADKPRDTPDIAAFRRDFPGAVISNCLLVRTSDVSGQPIVGFANELEAVLFACCAKGLAGPGTQGIIEVGVDPDLSVSESFIKAGALPVWDRNDIYRHLAKTVPTLPNPPKSDPTLATVLDYAQFRLEAPATTSWYSPGSNKRTSLKYAGDDIPVELLRLTAAYCMYCQDKRLAGAIEQSVSDAYFGFPISKYDFEHKERFDKMAGEAFPEEMLYTERDRSKLWHICYTSIAHSMLAGDPIVDRYMDEMRRQAAQEKIWETSLARTRFPEVSTDRQREINAEMKATFEEAKKSHPHLSRYDVAFEDPYLLSFFGIPRNPSSPVHTDLALLDVVVKTLGIDILLDNLDSGIPVEALL